MKRTAIIILITIFVANLFSCSKKEEIPTIENTYIKAKKLLDEKNYSEAAKIFEKIDDDFPFSKWAAQSQMMAVYAFYKDKNYSDVTRVVDDFIRVNPTNENLPYMHYMKSLSYYNQIPEIDRAQDNTKLASISFRELIARFPDSDYATDAKNKLGFINEHLAGARMSIGRYDISQENYVGAIKNFYEVINRYNLTNQAPEAYYRLAEIYHKNGLTSEFENVKQVLIDKFPDNDWSKKAQELQ